MIDYIDTLTGTPCPLCAEPITTGWATHEIRPDEWTVICEACDLTLELSEGK